MSKQPACCTPVVRQAMSAADAERMARAFKAVADPVRLRLLSMIASHEGGEACVCELTTAFDVSGSTISHHLKVLREAGLIDGERRGTWIYYRALPATLAAMSDALAPASNGPASNAPGSNAPAPNALAPTAAG